MAITNFISTVWSENLYQALNRQYVAAHNCNREFEGDIREQGSVVKICGVGDIAIQDYVKNANIGAPSTLTDTLRELVIDQAKYFNFQIDDVDRAQSNPKLMEAALKTAASALANQADSFILSKCSEAGSTISETVTADNIIDTLLKALTRLQENNVADPSDIIFEVSPAVAELIMKAKIGLSNGSDVMEKGCIGNLAGAKIFVSNNVVKASESGGVKYTCMARTKRSIAYAEQLSEIEAYRPELRFADAMKGLLLYGAKVVYPEEVVALTLSVKTA